VFASVSAGNRHTLAIKTDGSLWAWGDNGWGQLGDSILTNQSSPVKVMESVESVSAGNSHTLAIKTDGSLWAWGSNKWGYNAEGQLGDGTTTNSVPLLVKVMESATSVSAGLNYTLAIKNDGSLWAWGNNSYGQLGNGLKGYSEYPTLKTNFDRTPPVITVDPFETNPTNQDVTVVARTNEGTLNQESYTFTENGSFTFIATDEARNVTEKIVTITNIDKTAPIITVGSYSTLPTNQDVTVAASTNEGTLNKTSHTFTENGSFSFIATDLAGNVSEKTVTISHIDKTAPVITVTPYSTETTHLPLTVSVTTDEGTLNNESHTFNENGSFTFVATDLAGNVTEEDSNHYPHRQSDSGEDDFHQSTACQTELHPRS
jgi:hypothetical protein